MTEHRFIEFLFQGQKPTAFFPPSPNVEFPLALRPADNWQPTLRESIAAIQEATRTGELKRLVHRHGGALLLRGLPIQTADDYSEIAHAFGFVAHEEVGRPPVRTVVARNIKTANEGPPELPIWPHSEYGWSTVNPAWLTFCALEVPESGKLVLGLETDLPPFFCFFKGGGLIQGIYIVITTGGETPVISGIALVKALKQQAPEFVEKLYRKGVKYVYRYGVSTIVSTTGASVLDAYGQQVQPDDDEATAREKIEAEIRAHSHDFEWHDDGSLSVTHVVPSK